MVARDGNTVIFWHILSKKEVLEKKIENKYQDGYGDSQFNLNTITSTIARQCMTSGDYNSTLPLGIED